MEKKQFLYFVIYLLISCNPVTKEWDFKFNGRVKNLNGIKVMLQQNGKIFDEAIIKNDTFSVSGKLIDKSLCSVAFESDFYDENGRKTKWGHPVKIFVEKNSSYLITANNKDDILHNNYRIISNSKIENEFEGFNRLVKMDILKRKNHLAQLEIKRDISLEQHNQNAYSDFTDSIRLNERELMLRKNRMTIDFVLRNPNSYVSIYLLSSASDINSNLGIYQYINKKLKPEFLEHPYGVIFKNKLQTSEKMKSGKLNFKFSAIDNSGRLLDLKDFAGKKLIIFDFWATWCIPCVKEIPASLKLEKDFAKLNVSYVFVSYDIDKAHWVKQSALLGLTHSFIVDDKNKQILSDNLDISTIPRYVIMNPKGDVIVSDAPSPSSKEMRALINGLL